MQDVSFEEPLVDCDEIFEKQSIGHKGKSDLETGYVFVEMWSERVLKPS